MENNTYLDSSWPYIRQTGLLMSAGVAGDPKLSAGVLLGYSLLGLVSFILVFWFQRSRLGVLQESIISSCFRYYVKNTHDILCALIFTDAAIVITAVVMAIQSLTSTCSGLSCVIVFMIWFLLRYLGIVLHLLAALWSIVFLSPPQWGNALRYASSVLIVLVAVFLPLFIVIGMISIFVVAVFIFGLSLAIIIVNCATPTTMPSAALWKKLIVLVAMVTLFMTFIPTFVLQCLILNFSNPNSGNDIFSVIYANILLCTNLNVVLDALLCFYILKLPAGEEQQQLQKRLQQQLQLQQQQQQHR